MKNRIVKWSIVSVTIIALLLATVFGGLHWGAAVIIGGLTLGLAFWLSGLTAGIVATSLAVVAIVAIAMAAVEGKKTAGATVPNVIPPVAATTVTTTVTPVATPAPVVATATPAPAPAPTGKTRERIRVPLEPIAAGEKAIQHGRGAYEVRRKFIQPTNFIIAVMGATGTMQAKRSFGESSARREHVRRQLLAHVDQEKIEEALTAQLAANGLQGGHVELLPAPSR